MFTKAQFVINVMIIGTSKYLTVRIGWPRPKPVTDEEKVERSIVMNKKIARLKIEIERLKQLDDERRFDL